ARATVNHAPAAPRKRTLPRRRRTDRDRYERSWWSCKVLSDAQAYVTGAEVGGKQGSTKRLVSLAGRFAALFFLLCGEFGLGQQGEQVLVEPLQLCQALEVRGVQHRQGFDDPGPILGPCLRWWTSTICRTAVVASSKPIHSL